MLQVGCGHSLDPMSSCREHNIEKLGMGPGDEATESHIFDPPVDNLSYETLISM